MKVFRILPALAAVLALVYALGSCSGGSTTAPGGNNNGGNNNGGAYQRTVSAQWFDLIYQLGREQAWPNGPTHVARWLFMASSSMYDAWAAYDPVAAPVALDPALRRAGDPFAAQNQRNAVAYAGYWAVRRIYADLPNSRARADALLLSQGLSVQSTEDPTKAAGIGRLAVLQNWAARANDGSNEANGYADFAGSVYGELYVPKNSPDPSKPNSPGKPGFDVNRWMPLRVPNGTLLDANGVPVVDDNDPSTYSTQSFISPHWGGVKPFAMTRGDQFRPPPPPLFDGAAPYTDSRGNSGTNDTIARAQLKEVMDYTADLDDEKKIIYEYWAEEGFGWAMPPGHHNLLSDGISVRDRHDLEEDVKMYLLLNATLFDCTIAVWDAKRVYDYARPVSVARHLYHNDDMTSWDVGNDRKPMKGKDWMPFVRRTLLTPGFPEYPSGHSSFGAAWAEALTKFTGTNRYYDGTTRTNHDVNLDGQNDMLGQYDYLAGDSFIEPGLTPKQTVRLQWETLQEAGYEDAISRLYGGIHFDEGAMRSQEVGTAVAGVCWQRCQQYWRGQVQR